MANAVEFKTRTSGLLHPLFLGVLIMLSAATNAQTITAPGGGMIDCTDVTIDYADDPNLTEAEKLARMDEAFQRSLSQFDLCQTGVQSGQQAGGQASGQAGSQGGNEASGQDAGSAADAAAEAQAAADAAAEAQGNTQADADSAATSTSNSQAPSGSNWGPPPDVPSATPADTPPPQDSQPPDRTASAPPGQGTSATQSSATSDLSGTSGSTSASKQSPTGAPTGSESTDAVSQGSVASSDMTGTELPPVAPPAPPAPPIGGGQNTASVDPGGTGAPSPGEATGTQNISSNGAVPGDIPPADNDSVLEAQIRKAAINEKDPAVQKKLWNEYRKYKGLPTVN